MSKFEFRTWKFKFQAPKFIFRRLFRNTYINIYSNANKRSSHFGNNFVAKFRTSKFEIRIGNQNFECRNSNFGCRNSNFRHPNSYFAGYFVRAQAYVRAYALRRENGLCVMICMFGHLEPTWPPGSGKEHTHTYA